MNFLRLRRTPKLAVPKHETEILFADADGVLKQMGPDGSVVEVGSGGGGGSTPAGSDGQIQYNDGGTAFGASPDLVWVGGGSSGTLKLVTEDDGHAEITGNGLGVEIHLVGADGDADHVGGEVGITSGTSAGGNGGDIAIAAGGDDSAFGNGGNISIASGPSAQNDGGNINIRANPAGPAGFNGGDINIVAGAGLHAGNVVVQGGGTDGNVQFYSGDSTQAVQLDGTGLRVLGKVGFYGHAAVDQQTGVAVSVAEIHAALVNLGLITA